MNFCETHGSLWYAMTESRTDSRCWLGPGAVVRSVTNHFYRATAGKCVCDDMAVGGSDVRRDDAIVPLEHRAQTLQIALSRRRHQTREEAPRRDAGRLGPQERRAGWEGAVPGPFRSPMSGSLDPRAIGQVQARTTTSAAAWHGGQRGRTSKTIGWRASAAAPSRAVPALFASNDAAADRTSPHHEGMPRSRWRGLLTTSPMLEEKNMNKVIENHPDLE